MDINKNQITFYDTENGKIKIEVRYQNELEESATTEEFSVVII